MLGHSPSVVTSGLVLALDAANTKSYPGSGTAWTDLSGNGLNATINNSPTYSSSNVGILTYSGSVTNDTSTSTSSLYNVGTGDFAVELWMKSDGSGGYGPIFSLDDSLAGTGILLYAATSTNNLRTWVGNTANNSTIQVCDNVWHHIVVTRLSGTVAKYIDGVLDATHTAAGSCTTGQKAKIAWKYGAGYAYIGSVSKVNFYNIALTADQVLQNFNALRGRFGL
jgi:hypothetical protein